MAFKLTCGGSVGAALAAAVMSAAAAPAPRAAVMANLRIIAMSLRPPDRLETRGGWC